MIVFPLQNIPQRVATNDTNLHLCVCVNLLVSFDWWENVIFPGHGHLHITFFQSVHGFRVIIVISIFLLFSIGIQNISQVHCWFLQQFLQQPCQLACQKITFSNARMPWHKNGVDVCQTWLLRRLQILSFSKNPFYLHEHVHWVAEEETWGKVSDSNQATVFVTVTISIVRLDFDANIRNQNLDPPSKTITAPCPSVNIARWRCKLFQ